MQSDDTKMGHVSTPSQKPAFAFPSGGMRARVRDFDWASTPLGARERWSSELILVTEQVLDSGFPKAVAWGPELTTIYNDAFRPILGEKPEALGRSFADIWSEAWDEIGPIARRALEGEATYIEDYPLLINRSGQLETACFTFCYSPLRLRDGTVAGILDTVVETTATVRAQADLSVANQELAHRLKNTLALVQAIASQTLRHVTPKEAVTSFRDRIQALAYAHDVLLKQNWASGSLKQIICDSLEPHNDHEQFEISGPELMIGSRAAMSLSLMLHELATNAVKYGALSARQGRVFVSWHLDAGHLVFHWREAGGPTVSEPCHKGFGSRLTARGVGIRSKISRNFPPEGFQLHMTVPIEEIGS